MANDQLPSEIQLIHWGPVWNPRREPGKSLGLCEPEAPSMLSTDESMVNCEACGKIMRAQRDGEYGV